MSNRTKETRSNSGCWTCRLRRKKCDETQPRCINCTSLQISCFGYGQKPDWIDGGDMERAVAKATTDAVRQTTIRNRNRRFKRSKESSNSAATADTFSSQRPSDSDVIDTDASSVEADIDVYDVSMHDIADISPHCATILDFSSEFSKNTNTALIQETGRSPPPTEISITNKGRSLSLDSSTSRFSIEETNISSIMTYMDSVFFLQFPLQGPLPTKGGRGWLLWILIHVRPLQIITGALCAQCHGSQHFPPSSTNFNSAHENKLEERSFLLSELNQYVGRVSAQDMDVREGKIGVLACTIKLIFLEVFQGGSLTWKMHLEATSSIVAFLTAGNFSSRVTDILSTSYYEAFKFFAGLFVWFDVISAATMGTKPLLQDEDERLLESNVTDLGTLVGCDNWIVVIILKIAAIHHWKKERERDGRSSLVELVRRAEPLERRPKQSLMRSLSSTYLSAINSDPPVTQGDSQRDIITSIFVGSTLSYLHSVISGPHPDLAEIRESFNMTIKAFKKLPYPWLLRSLAWPFCITGCFALPEERSLIRNLVSAAGVHGPSSGNLWKALEVIEECWKIRESSLGVCDWLEAASSLGYDILLI